MLRLWLFLVTYGLFLVIMRGGCGLKEVVIESRGGGRVGFLL